MEPPCFEKLPYKGAPHVWRPEELNGCRDMLEVLQGGFRGSLVMGPAYIGPVFNSIKYRFGI